MNKKLTTTIMRVLLLSTLLLIDVTLCAQNTLNGTVYLYKEKGNNIPLEGVNLTVLSGGSQMTKQNGAYSFAFDNQVSVITLQAIKKGYEVINEEEIKTLELAKKQQQHIYFDVEGNTKRRQRAFEDIYFKQARIKRDSYFGIIEQGGKEFEQLKLQLEKESGKKFENDDDIKSYISERYGADTKIIESMIAGIVRQNLDHANKKVAKIQRWLLEGKIDSIRLINDTTDLKADSIRFSILNEQEINIQKTKEEEKQGIIIRIPQMLLDRQYEKIEKNYHNLMLLDPTDYKIKIDFASFLDEQNKKDKAIALYNLCITDGKIDSILLSEAENELGVLLRQMKEMDAAIKHVTRSIEIRKAFAIKDSSIYGPSLAKSYNSLAIVFHELDSLKEAAKLYKESVAILKALKSPTKESINTLASSLANLGGLYEEIDEIEVASHYLEDGLRIIEEAALKNPEEHDPFLAGISNRVATHYHNTSTNAIRAREYFIKALRITKRLYEKNRDAYQGILVEVLNNSAQFYQKNGDLNQAENQFLEALALVKKLSSENPAIYNDWLATVLNNLAKLQTDKNDFQQAILNYSEAVNVTRKSEGKNPGIYEKKLAIYLQNLASALLGNDNRDDSLRAQELLSESIDFYRKLAKNKPEKYEIDLVHALNTHATHVKNAEAEKYFEEALLIIRKLALANPDKHNRGLVLVLRNYASGLLKNNDSLNAYKYYNESIDILRKLVQKDPNANISDLGRNLVEMANLLYRTMKDTLTARIYFEEVKGITKEVLVNYSDYVKYDFTKYLEHYSEFLLSTNDTLLAIRWFEESINIRRPLALSNKNFNNSTHFLSIINLGNILYKTGHKARARMYYREAIEVGATSIYATSFLDNKFLRSIHMAIGNISREMQDTSSAIESDSHVLQIDINIYQAESNNIRNHINVLSGASNIAKFFNKKCNADSASRYFAIAYKYADTAARYMLENHKTQRSNVDTDEYVAYLNFASWNGLNIKRCEQAIKYAEAVLKINPEHRRGRENKAYGLLLSGKYENALALFKALLNEQNSQDTAKSYRFTVLEDLKSLECSGAIPKERKADVKRIKDMLLKND